MTVDAAIGSLTAAAHAALPQAARTRDAGSPISLDVDLASLAEAVKPAGNADSATNDRTSQGAVPGREDVDEGRREEADDATAAKPDISSARQYRYRLDTVEGLGRPLVEVVDAESEQTVYSYPPQHMVRLLETASRLGQEPPILAQVAKLDESA